MSDMEIRRIVYGLLQAGLVEVVRPEGMPLPPQARQLPPVDKRNVANLIKYEAHQQIPFPLDEVIWDYQAIDRGFLPPTINQDEPDPGCDLDFIPNQGRAAAVEAALCNCLGFGSKNSALVLGRARDIHRGER